MKFWLTDMDWLFRVYTLESIPYITKMSEISENQTDEYEMEGMFAEVFFALQVFSCSPHIFTKIRIPNFHEMF